MALSTLRHVLFVLAISSLVLAIAEAFVVKQIGEMKQFNGIPGVTHITLAGAVAHGHKEVEAWLGTVTPGVGSPIHRHDCEEILIILKGSGTVYVAPESQNVFPGEPKGTLFSANSTISVPGNVVHKVVNTNDEDLQVITIFSRTPMKVYVYKDWKTPHDEAMLMSPIVWDKPEEAILTEDELRLYNK